MKKNLSLLIVSIVVSYVFIELALWRNVLDWVPLTLHTELGRLQYLAQTSKKGIVPRNYMLIVGDSYAEGLGDWLLEVVRDGNPDHNAAHVIHRRTGRDVLSFGFRGGYPGWTYTFQATKAFDGLQVYALIDVPQPIDVLAFFYAGNDFNDEMAGIRYWLPPEFDRARLSDAAYVRDYLAGLGRNGERAAKRRWHALRNAHMFDTATKLVKLAWRNFRRKMPALASTDNAFQTLTPYRPDWSRYVGSTTSFATRNGPKPYPPETVEPPAFHTPAEIEQAGLFFQEALRYLGGRFPKARLWIVFIPTPIDAYRIVEDGVFLRDRIMRADTEKAGPRTYFTKAALKEATDRICRSALAAGQAVGALFIDTRPHLRQKSYEVGYLHGPKDAGHFNKQGYTALAEAIIDGMGRGGDPACR